MPPKKINVKERFSDGEIDLSMSDLQEVPVKDIAVFRKTFSLDLSNNFLVALPTTFATLTNLTKLDLSKNQLKELPDNFGELTKLRHLDLYQNQLEYLPLSFSKLKSLKWLDLKDNPLVPAVAKVAGPCLVTKDCEKCARDVVNVFSNLHEQIENDKETRKKNQQKQLEINQQKEMELKKNKKKEKSKLGKKEANGPLPVKPLHKKNKKHDKKPQGKAVVSPSSSGLKLLFTSVIVVFISLFVATSTKCSYTKNVEVAVTDLYVQGVNVLPPNLQEYSISAGNYVRFVHNKTGNFTLEAVNYLQNKENYVKAYNALGEVIERLLHKVKEQYNQFVS